jgi:hypothetical protein
VLAFIEYIAFYFIYHFLPVRLFIIIIFSKTENFYDYVLFSVVLMGDASSPHQKIYT